MSTGLAPFSTALRPAVIIDWVKIVAVVVPSPANSFVLFAASYTSLAPMFSNLSSSSTSLAMVTPSFVITGEPNDFSNTTFLPFGPKVTLTASANLFTPSNISWRASLLYLISFAMIIPSFYFIQLLQEYSLLQLTNILSDFL